MIAVVTASTLISFVGFDVPDHVNIDDVSVQNAVGGAVPEPATWAMMIGGFGAIGGTMRYRRRKTTVAFA